MRILVAASGSRGDTQPMLALALALRGAGHEVTLAGSPTAAEDAASFGFELHRVGNDISAMVREQRQRMGTLGPLTAFRVLTAMMRDEVQKQFDGLWPLARRADLVVAGGAQLAARVVAEGAGARFRYFAYAPEMVPSRYHPPFLLPRPLWRPLNSLAWTVIGAFYNRLLRSTFARMFRTAGLAPIRDLTGYVFDPRFMVLAMEPELARVPPDIEAEPLGAFHLPDPRPLPDTVEAFLCAGPPPVYVGFGSMPDPDPAETTATVARAAKAAGVRVVLSRGWAGMGDGTLGDGVLPVGPVNHGKLFPRLLGAVHHGGAGTTAAAARAGVPQIVVPHGFDQFGWARRVHQAGLSPEPFPRSRLTLERLTRSLLALREGAPLRQRAAALGEVLRARDGLSRAVRQLEEAP